jgi:hypothetical protein
MSGRLKRWLGKDSVLPVSLLVGLLLISPPSIADGLIVTYTTPDGDLAINQMHSWILHIEDEDGLEIEGAIIDVAGGMPEHDHGLPTKPRVTVELGGGDYRLEGMRFHMKGYWEIVVSITTDAGHFDVMVPLQL